MTAPEQYDVGDEVRLAAVFTANTIPADPTTVKFQIRHRNDDTFQEWTFDPLSGPLKQEKVLSDPDNPDSPLVKVPGSYYFDFTFDKSGRWWWRFVGLGAIVSTIERTTVVREAATIQA